MTSAVASRIDRDTGIAWLTLDRQARRNALDREMVGALADALARLDEDARVAAIILHGEGAGFCAGSDLKYAGRLSRADMCRFEQETGDMARRIGTISKPVIAAIEGFAIGGGLILAASCDLVVASGSARLSLPEVPLGWLTPWGLQALVARVGAVRARTLCFNLAEIPVAEARAIGLVDHVCPAGSASTEAQRLAGQLVALPGEAVMATKHFFAARIMAGAETADIEANRLFAANWQTEHARTSLGHSRAEILGLEL